MIGHIRGKILTREPDRVLVEAAGTGVGYEIRVSARTLVNMPPAGDEVTLAIHTQVREDAITLFGFLDEGDRALYRLVQSVTGIGPKLALAVQGTVEPGVFAQAILADDVTGLSRIPGLGKKTASRLCLELKDKVSGLGVISESAPDGAPAAAELSPAEQDATAALAALGYSAREIKRALTHARPTVDDNVQSLLKRALKELSPA